MQAAGKNGQIQGFLEFGRGDRRTRPVGPSTTMSANSSYRWKRTAATQAARCMDCGVPCYTHG